MKQEYLVNAIVNKNYDIEAFASFMGSKRENGTNVDAWEYEELQKVSVFYLHKHLRLCLNLLIATARPSSSRRLNNLSLMYPKASNGFKSLAL